MAEAAGGSKDGERKKGTKSTQPYNPNDATKSGSRLLSASEGGAKMTKTEKVRLQRYSKGTGNTAKGVTKHRLKLSIKRSESKISAAEKRAAQAELLLPSEAGELEADGKMERTAHFTQKQLASEVDLQSQAKAYNMVLDKLGPYRACYTRNGRRLLLGGRKGHIAICGWEQRKILHEIQVRETVRDVCFLKDETMFAAAQHKHLYIYDGSGVELHCLRNHKPHANRIAFLPYHWLLTTIGSSGRLRYLDVSTGQNVADTATRLGECDCMRVNPWNALVHLGHHNGTVTLWTPNMPEPVVKLLSHKGGVSSLAVDRSGNYMASAGLDGQLRVWDLRTYRPLHSYFCPRPASSIDISDRGMLAAVHGPSVQIFRNCLSERANGPYMRHLLPGCLTDSARFCPYEDVLGIGHSNGFCSMLVPGAGEPNFDSFEANPFASKQQRRESEVVSLLEKLPPETIMLDPSRVNTVDRNQLEREKEFQAAKQARLAELEAGKRVKKKTRGRSKATKKLAKKESNIMDEKRKLRQQELEKHREEGAKRAAKKRGEEPPGWSPLERFAPKKTD